MTIPAQLRTVSFNANGTVGPYGIPFIFYANSEINVRLLNATAAGTPLVLGTHYSVTGGAGSAGSILLTAAGAALAIAPLILKISGATIIAQGVAYTSNGAFPAKSNEGALDRLTAIAQEQRDIGGDLASRALQVPAGETVAVLPAAAARVNRWLGFDGVGTMLLATASTIALALTPFLPPGPPGPASGDQFFPEDYGAIGNTTVAKNGTIVPGADDTAAVQACWRAAQLAHGTVIYRKWFNVQDLTVENNADPDGNGIPTQKTLVMRSAGSFHAGINVVPFAAGGGLVFTGAAGSASGKDIAGRINTYGVGFLDISGTVMLSNQTGAGSGRPFIRITNTSCKIEWNACWTPKTGFACNDDPVVCGGNTETLGSGPLNAFQGYGTTIQHNWFNGCRAVAVGVFANSVTVHDNTWWYQCGSNEGVTGSQIRLDGQQAAVGTQTISGLTITANLIECPASYRPISMTSVVGSVISGNSAYDTAISTCTVWLGPNCEGNVITAGGLPPAGKPYLLDPFNQKLNNAITIGYNYEESTFPSIRAGRSGYPCHLEYVTFNGVNGSVFIQPDAAGTGGTFFGIKRSALEGTNPNAYGHSWGMEGNKTVSGNQAGNVANAETNGASYSAQGRTWSSANIMTITATGGNPIILNVGNLQIFDSAGTTKNASIGPLFGGAGLPGIGFGTALDVSIWRANSTTLAVQGALRLESRTVAGLGSAATAGSGAMLNCSNEIGGITPVFSDATNWRRVADRAIAS